MSERCRWMIEGTLTTRSPMHIGSGEVWTEDCLSKRAEAGGTSAVEVSAVSVDARGRAYIPGSAIRGALRSLLLRYVQRRGGLAAPSNPADDPRVVGLFGSQQSGSRLEFRDAFLDDSAGAPTFGAAPPCWNPVRHTGIATSVAIDRVTRAARRQLLFHEEFVPEGVSFAASVVLHDATEEDVVRLLGLLGAFDRDLTTVGAGGGGGWGRLAWGPRSIRRMRRDDVRRWLSDPHRPMAVAAMTPVAAEETDALRTRARAETDALSTVEDGWIHADFALEFDSDFLVNEPTRRQSDDDPDHAPLLDAHGRPMLRETAVHSVLRSQAERILRTVAGSGACCGIGTAHDRCAPKQPGAGRAHPTAGLCPVCRLFGSTNWATVLHTTRFTSVADVNCERRDQIAVDRFTGGVAGSKKFDALVALAPTLRGRISLNLDRLSSGEGGPVEIALLLLLFRDLLEGDLSFGFGSARGQGTCRGRIEDWRLPDWKDVPPPLATRLGMDAAEWDAFRSAAKSQAPVSAALRTAMEHWIDAATALPAARK